ncbi:MAG: F0F1 ATP synthase subunit B [Minisyncoccus archaeiphilus]|jgi:F-type H+-transporting ATPase subunit b|uniref:F0F1 ATP synthase subunit B n=1 Tax=Minisyncoccus archaeiphilus TaxID=3238481 RepID=UPI0009C4EA4A|nr:MAG: ATP synthase subunit b, sodium ion specific [Parcubacteria group bacterium ADurb.Bin216]GMX59274.1 MAG: F0F1 ATP synthase subunit B [Candidatus Parcubacteria bacterium]
MEVDFGVLIGQIINFAILFFVLSYFVHKPFLNLLKKRREVIEEGVRKAEEADKKLLDIEKMKDAAAKQSDSERKDILVRSESEAKNRAEVIIKSAETDRLAILEKAQKDSEALKEKSKEKTKEEIVNNAFDLAEKILKEKIDVEKNKKITAEFLSKVKI